MHESFSLRPWESLRHTQFLEKWVARNDLCQADLDCLRTVLRPRYAVISVAVFRKLRRTSRERSLSLRTPRITISFREGGKTAQVVAMLQRKNGATLSEIDREATHSRPFFFFEAELRGLYRCLSRPAPRRWFPSCD